MHKPESDKAQHMIATHVHERIQIFALRVMLLYLDCACFNISHSVSFILAVFGIWYLCHIIQYGRQMEGKVGEY